MARTFAGVGGSPPPMNSRAAEIEAFVLRGKTHAQDQADRGGKDASAVRPQRVGDPARDHRRTIQRHRLGPRRGHAEETRERNRRIVARRYFSAGL